MKEERTLNKIFENTQTQMRKGVLEFCILHIISRGEIYSSDIIKELKDAKVIVVEGTIYPLLTKLQNSQHKLLDYTWRESSSGPPQKHYKLTQKGKELLSKLNITWSDLVESTNYIINKQKHTIKIPIREEIKIEKKS